MRHYASLEFGGTNPPHLLVQPSAENREYHLCTIAMPHEMV
jgi:hypothetical protein